MALKNNWKTLVDNVDYVSAEPINQIAEAVIGVEDKNDELETKIDTHILDTKNPHNVTAEQTGAYDKNTVDEKITEARTEAGTISTSLSAHVNDTDNPHGVTASQTGAYDKAQTDELLNGKSDVGHIHPLANVGVNTNLAGIEIRCTSYEGATAPTTVLSYRDETSIEEKYIFPNDQYYSDFSIFSAGDRVSLLFEGNCMITVNGKSISVDGTYTLSETLLTAPIDVMTEFGHVVNVTILYAEPKRDGFMSASDKEALQGVQASLGDIDTALDAILAMQDKVIGGETA